MTITTEHIQKLAKLTRIAVTPETLPIINARLSKLIELIQTMQTVNTEDVTPLIHPVSFMYDAAIDAAILKLREDVLDLNATQQLAHNDMAESRDVRMMNAPVVQDGYFLVPRVLD
jgi:aspartyl-tRNA(Asn)/glutamyl-tRNA(Gln) amidotransferase subunit C